MMVQGNGKYSCTCGLLQLEITVWRAPPLLEKMLELLLQECTDVSSCIREATDDVMYVEENLKKQATCDSSCPCMRMMSQVCFK